MVDFALNLSLKHIVSRVLLAIVIGGIIGYERGTNNRPAGFRTHILVCLGATIVSLIQDHLRINILDYAISHPDVAKVMKTDLGRIGAQVVSGIGFLGAGTIIREKKNIAGLTTAASIWVTGCIGLGIGWGFYTLSIVSGITVLVILITFKRVEKLLIDTKITKTLTICYTSDKFLSQDLLRIYEIFKNHHIKIKNLVKDTDSKKIVYTITMPKVYNQVEILAALSELEYLCEIRDF